MPSGGTYSVQEAAPGSGYAKADADLVGQDELERDNWWSFTNARDKKLISVSATKSWLGEGTWAGITRPDSVTVHLEYRVGATGSWINLRRACRTTRSRNPGRRERRQDHRSRRRRLLDCRRRNLDRAAGIRCQGFLVG